MFGNGAMYFGAPAVAAINAGSANQGASVDTSVSPNKVQWGRPFSNVTFPEDITGEDRAIALDWNDGTLSQFLIFANGQRKAWQLNTIDGNVKMDVLNVGVVTPNMLSRFYTDADGPKIGWGVQKGENVLWISYDMDFYNHSFPVPNNCRYIMPGFGFIAHMAQANLNVDTPNLEWSNMLYETVGAAANVAINFNSTNTGAVSTFVVNEPGFTLQITSTSNIIINGVSQLVWTSAADFSTLTLVKTSNGDYIATAVTGSWV